MSLQEAQYEQVKRKAEREYYASKNTTLGLDERIACALLVLPEWQALAQEAEAVARAQHFQKNFLGTEEREEVLKATPGGKELLQLYFHMFREEDERNGIRDEGIIDHGYW